MTTLIIVLASAGALLVALGIALLIRRREAEDDRSWAFPLAFPAEFDD